MPAYVALEPQVRIISYRGAAFVRIIESAFVRIIKFFFCPNGLFAISAFVQMDFCKICICPN